MKPTQILHERGQSLWLDNISRGMLDSGQLQRYIDKYTVTGLTSNPSIFDKPSSLVSTMRRSQPRPGPGSATKICSSSWR